MIGGSYKQQCPSCEAMVLVKSPALVGKKIECPKCKDRFIVAKPAPVKKPAEIDDEEEEEVEAPRSDKLKAGKPPLKKPQAKVRDEEDDDDDDEELTPSKKPSTKAR